MLTTYGLKSKISSIKAGVFFVFVFLKSCYIVLSERMLDYVWAINLGFGMFF